MVKGKKRKLKMLNGWYNEWGDILGVYGDCKVPKELKNECLEPTCNDKEN